MRRRALLASLAVGFAGCSGRDGPAEATDGSRTPTAGRTTPATITRTRTGPTVVGPGDQLVLPGGFITLGEFVGPQATVYQTVNHGGEVLGGNGRIFAVLDADLSAYQDVRTPDGPPCKVTTTGADTTSERATLAVQLRDGTDRLAVPLPTGGSPSAAATLLDGADRRYRLPMPDGVLAAMAHTPDLSVEPVFPDAVSTSRDTTEVEVAFIVRNNGDRRWTLDCRADHDTVQDAGWRVQANVPAGERRRVSTSVLVWTEGYEEVTFEASWGFGETEATVPVKREH